MLRVLREWVLARSAPASPLARACALHLLCRDAGFLHDAGMVLLAGLRVCLMVLLAAFVCMFGQPRFGSLRSRKPPLVCLMRCIC